MLRASKPTYIKWLLLINGGRRGQCRNVDAALDRLSDLLDLEGAEATRAIETLELAVKNMKG